MDLAASRSAATNQLLGIGNGIINNSIVGQAINAPLVLGDNRNITLTMGGGNVSLGGAISGPAE